MTSNNSASSGATTDRARPGNGPRADRSPRSNNPSDRPQADNADLMTGQRPPSEDSAPVGFGVFAAAFALDMLLHITVGVAVWFVVSRSPGAAVGPIIAGVAAGTAASLVHRTLVQRIFRTTAGKAVFGLQLRQADGTYPSLWRLVKQWFHGVLATIGAPLQILG